MRNLHTLVLSFLVAIPSQAQRVATADVSGAVIDSVHARPLVGAEVVLDGTQYRAITDSAGRFTLKGVVPGQYRAGFFHPLLDSLSLSLGTLTLTVPVESGKAILLALPSAATLMRGLCPTAGRETSAIVGRVVNPETDEPVVAATVTLAWTDFEASKGRGLVRTPRRLVSTTDGSGAYRLCSLPTTLDALIVARSGGASTPPVSVSTRGSGFVLHSLGLLPPGAASVSNATLSGQVRSTQGEALSGAKIVVPGSAATTTTATDGRFFLGGLPSGTRNIIVRRVGYLPAMLATELTSRETRTLNVSLERFVPVLDTVFVRASRDRGLAQVGFTERRRRGLGDFRTRADFEKSNPQRLSDILGMMRGVKLAYLDGKPVVTASRESGGCVNMRVDGVPWHSFEPGDTDDMIYPDDIAAIEVYSGVSVPAELEGAQGRGCLAVVIWTRTKIRDGGTDRRR